MPANLQGLEQTAGARASKRAANVPNWFTIEMEPWLPCPRKRKGDLKDQRPTRRRKNRPKRVTTKRKLLLRILKNEKKMPFHLIRKSPRLKLFGRPNRDSLSFSQVLWISGMISYSYARLSYRIGLSSSTEPFVVPHCIAHKKVDQTITKQMVGTGVVLWWMSWSQLLGSQRRTRELSEVCRGRVPFAEPHQASFWLE